MRSRDHLPTTKKGKPITDGTSHATELVFTRVVDAARELVFRCPLEPEHLTHFWGAGGSASVFGYSSGAVLAMWAAARGLPITRLALYDPPFQVRGTGPDYWTELARQIDGLVRAGRRGDAVELFQTQGVGVAPEVVAHLAGARSDRPHPRLRVADPRRSTRARRIRQHSHPRDARRR